MSLRRVGPLRSRTGTAAERRSHNNEDNEGHSERERRARHPQTSSPSQSKTPANACQLVRLPGVAPTGLAVHLLDRSTAEDQQVMAAPLVVTQELSWCHSSRSYDESLNRFGGASDCSCSSLERVTRCDPPSNLQTIRTPQSARSSTPD